MKYIGADTLKVMQDAQNYNNYMAELCFTKLGKPTELVDFGAGIGTISKWIRTRNVNIRCVECDEDLRNILKENKFETYEEISQLKDGSVTNIMSLNVLEHILDDKNILSQIYEKLSNKGKFLLLVPANSFLYSKFDKELGHFRRYNMDNLQELVKSCGFTILNYEYFDSLGFVCACIYKLFNRTGKITRFSILLFDRILFPISIYLDKIFNKIFGKNIILLLTKEP